MMHALGYGLIAFGIFCEVFGEGFAGSTSLYQTVSNSDIVLSGFDWFHIQFANDPVGQAINFGMIGAGVYLLRHK